MRQMKESGVQWLGIVPANWEISRLKSRISKRFGGAWGEEPTPDNMDNARLCIRIADFDFNTQTVKSSASTLRVYTYSQIYKTKLLDGDIIVEKSGGGEKTPVGRTIIYNSQQFNGAEVLFANFCECFRLKNVESKFFAYIMKSFYQSNDMHLYFNQTTGLQNLDIEAVINSKAVFPPLEIQKGIVSFLDKECAKIDSIYADVEKQIETLEQYKRSIIQESVTKGLNPEAEIVQHRIKYVGCIPKDWEVKKGKFIFGYIQKPVKDDDGVITCFRDGEVTLRSNRREDGFTISEKEIGYQGIDVGDLIVHGMDGFAGSIGISDSRGKASPVLNNLLTDQNKRYYMYYLRTMAYKGVFISLSTGIRVRTCDTNWGKLREIYYALPPIEEQEEIANYLDKKCAEIESVIADKKKQLEVLDNYKKSLIYEYVTGKKEVVNE